MYDTDDSNDVEDEDDSDRNDVGDMGLPYDSSSAVMEELELLLSENDSSNITVNSSNKRSININGYDNNRENGDGDFSENSNSNNNRENGDSGFSGNSHMNGQVAGKLYNVDSAIKKPFMWLWLVSGSHSNLGNGWAVIGF